MTPTTYGRDFAYCLKSHGGVRGFNASLWRFLLRCTLFCHSVATFLTSVSSYEGGCGFEGNVIEKVVDSKVPVVCCGEKMQELIPNTVDASGEKHVPVVTRLDDCRIKVEVGSVAHPMTPEHHISFIYVETENGGIRVNLKDKPEAVICVCHDKPVAVYEYCNLHGLWKTEL